MDNVDIERTQRDFQNGDKRRLVRPSEIFCSFLPHEPPKMADNRNVAERNTLPILYNITLVQLYCCNINIILSLWYIIIIKHVCIYTYK